MFQIHRHTSECDTVPLEGEIDSYERAVYVLGRLCRDHSEDDFEIVDLETGRYVSWVLPS